MRRNIIDAYASILACGIDVEKSLFFIQSHVPTHAQIAWADGTSTAVELPVPPSVPPAPHADRTASTPTPGANHHQ